MPTLETDVSEVDIVITTTGNNDIIAVETTDKIQNNAFVSNIGLFDNEIDVTVLELYPQAKKVEINTQVHRFESPTVKVSPCLLKAIFLT